jgi:hypothetical protein
MCQSKERVDKVGFRDVKNWDQESNKANRTKKLTNVLDFHEFKMIHGR